MEDADQEHPEVEDAKEGVARLKGQSEAFK